MTTIRQADITNAVGTSDTPFVTAPLEKMSIDALVAQWGDQWQAFYERETADVEATNAFWKQQWATWFTAQTTEIQEAYISWDEQWNAWFGSQTENMEATSAFWKQQWSTWFNNYVNNNTSEMVHWREEAQNEYYSWFGQLQAILAGDVAANITNQVLELKKRTEILEIFSGNVISEYAICHQLSDNGYKNYCDVLDSSENDIIDSDLDTINARTHSSELILDSNGGSIDTRVIFVVK